jgi:hypothetical protein
MEEKKCTKESKKKWGSVLVEKRPCIGQQDGRTMMEKAHKKEKRKLI